MFMWCRGVVKMELATFFDKKKQNGTKKQLCVCMWKLPE